MSLEAFNSLSVDKQGYEVAENGKYYGTFYGIILYAYNNFFVEIYYCSKTQNVKKTKALSLNNLTNRFFPLMKQQIGK